VRGDAPGLPAPPHRLHDRDDRHANAQKKIRTVSGTTTYPENSPTDMPPDWARPGAIAVRIGQLPVVSTVRLAVVTFDLERFVTAQDGVYERARAEIAAGRKRSHWMWFIFPQIQGLGSSPTAQRYAIRSLDEARAYLAHPVLGPRLLECTELLRHATKPASEIFGHPDDLKLCSSMTLFAAAAPDPTPFHEVITHLCGAPDRRTTDILDGVRGDQ